MATPLREAQVVARASDSATETACEGATSTGTSDALQQCERPHASSPMAQRRMERQKRRDTAVEIAIRQRVHAMGLRFRVDRAPMPPLRRRADLVFSSVKLAVFIDGCFWHGCPEHGTWPRANADWWRAKIETNKQRDCDTNRRLAEAGWEVLRIWEHEDPDDSANRIASSFAAARAKSRQLADRRRDQRARILERSLVNRGSTSSHPIGED